MSPPSECFRTIAMTMTMMITIAGVTADDGDFISSRATYFKSPHGLGNARGACGYGDHGRTIYGGSVAAVSKLYRDGIGCGACYQVRCKIPGICSEDGDTVVAVDYGQGGDKGTDFILSERAFSRLAASPDDAHELFAQGVVDVEFRRVPCRYGSNLLLAIREQSRRPGYLALLPIYQPDNYDIVGIDYYQDKEEEWKHMRKPYGAVWDVENPPPGDLMVKIKLRSHPYPEAPGERGEDEQDADVDLLIPAKWEPGTTFDTGFSGAS